MISPYFTSIHNTTHQHTGTLWEGRFKSILMEEGVASRAMATYIDLKVVEKGIDPAVAEEEMKRLIGCSDLLLSQVVRYRMSPITQSAPPDNHLLDFKVHHLRM